MCDPAILFCEEKTVGFAHFWFEYYVYSILVNFVLDKRVWVSKISSYFSKI